MNENVGSGEIPITMHTMSNVIFCLKYSSCLSVWSGYRPTSSPCYFVVQNHSKLHFLELTLDLSGTDLTDAISLHTDFNTFNTLK